jgi:hypothetical protein
MVKPFAAYFLLISRLTAFLMGNKLAQAVGGVPTAICKAQLICGLAVVGTLTFNIGLAPTALLFSTCGPSERTLAAQ